MSSYKKNIKDFIPQREPFIMVDEVLNAESGNGTALFTPNAENVFHDAGLLTEPGLIEHMAQSAAAVQGVYYEMNKIPAPVGYIGGIKSLKIHQLPLINQPIQTEVETIHKLLQVQVIQLTSRQNNQVICSCEMKIFITP